MFEPIESPKGSGLENLIGFGAIGLICAYFHIKGLQRDLAAQEAAASGSTSPSASRNTPR